MPRREQDDKSGPGHSCGQGLSVPYDPGGVMKFFKRIVRIALMVVAAYIVGFVAGAPLGLLFA